MDITVATVLYMMVAITQLSPVSGAATIFYKISESQFNEVTEFSLVNTAAQTNTGYGAIKYEREPLGKADNIKVTIPRDGILRTTAHYDYIAVTGSVELKLQETSFLDFSSAVTFNDCSLFSEGNIDSVVSVKLLKGTSISFQVKGSCQFQCRDYTASGLFNHTLGQYAGQSAILEMLQDTVCQNYNPNFEMRFKEKGIKFKLSLLNMTYDIMDTHIEVINSNVIMTSKIAFPLAYPSIEEGPTEVPDVLLNSKEPFEIWMHSSFVNEALSDSRRRVFDHNRNFSMSMLMKMISKHNVQKLGVLIPKLDSTFPDSTYDIVVTDMTASGNMSDNSFWAHMNITGAVTATLNCDPTRTYIAFKFRALIEMPIQVGFDRKNVGMKLQTFRGNFTILETQIGRVADRFIQSIFYILPQLVADHELLKPETGLRGSRVSELIPNGRFIEDAKLNLYKDYIVIGGKLTTTNTERNKIPYDNITWVGEVGDLDFFSFPFFDDTPENATGLPTQNCTGPPHVISASESLNTSVSMAAIIAACLVTYFLSRDANVYKMNV